MSKEFITKCDRCGSIEKDEEKTLRVSINKPPYKATGPRGSFPAPKDLCGPSQSGS